MNKTRHTAAFTLIEILISITLGLVLLLTCFAGLRISAQSLIASQRLAHENALLRIGVEQAMEEVDFWKLADDPTNSASQQLRGTEPAPAPSNGNGFLPFTPFTSTPDYATTVNGSTGFEDSSTGFDESTTTQHAGWNPNPLAWAAWNPRTWTQVNLVEEGCEPGGSNLTQAWGTTEIYDNLDKTQSWHYWHDDQVRSLVDALGFYGMYEYLPSNAYIIYHGPSAPLGSSANTSPQISWNFLPEALLRPSAWICPPDCDEYVKGRVRNTNGSRLFLPGPQAQAVTQSGLARTYSDLGYSGNRGPGEGFSFSQITTFLNNTVVSADLLPMRPTTWDDVAFETHRYIERGHPLALCMVSCRSSQNGGNFVISFTCTGTTLRGARQQRLPPGAASASSSSGGWVTNPVTDPTLDYQVPP